MRTITLILLFILASCGSGGGGSSSGGGTNVTIPRDDQDTIYEYRLFVEGQAGTSMASEAIQNFGDPDQANLAYNWTLDPSESKNIAIFGRSAFWQVQKTGGGDLTIRLVRDGIEVSREVLTTNGQVTTLTDNI